MPESFSFVFPDLLCLQDTQTRIKSALISSEHTSFITILNQLIHSTHPSLLSAPQRTGIQAALQKIWETSSNIHNNSNMLIPIHKKYESLLQKPYLISALMKSIIAARFHAIKMQSKRQLATFEQFQNLQETQQRLNFTNHILSILTAELSSAEVTPELHYFIISGISDAYHISLNIANGLFSKHFTSNIENLKKYWDDATSGTKLLLMNAQLLFIIYQKEATLCLADINTYTVPGLLCVAKYYFAIGQNDLALVQLKSINAEIKSTKLDGWVLNLFAQEFKPNITQLLAEVDTKQKKITGNVYEKKSEKHVNSIESNHENFSIIFPDPLPLADSKKRIVESVLAPSTTSFFDILNQLIYHHYHPLLDLAHYTFMQERIKEIWDSNSLSTLSFCISELLLEQSYLQNLIPLIVAARFQAIENHKKTDLSKEENIFHYIKEIHQRIQFMGNIENILTPECFSKNTAIERYSFFSGLFIDIFINMQTISNGLFNNYFTENFNHLKNYWESAQKIGDDLVNKLLSQHNIHSNTQCLIDISKRSLSIFICYPQYHFAIGQDDIALNYSGTQHHRVTQMKKANPLLYTQLEAELISYELTLHDKLLKDWAKLIATIETDYKRKMYVKLLACFEDQDEINTQGHLLTSPLENTLKENLAQLQQCTEIDDKIFDLISNSIVALGFAYEQNYNKNLNNIDLCNKTIAHLQKIMKHDKGSIIAAQISDHLEAHKNKIEQAKSDINLQNAQERLKDLKTQKLNLQKTYNQLQQTHTQTGIEHTQILENINTKVEALKTKQLALQKAKALIDTQRNKNKQQKQQLTKNILNLTHFNALARQDVEKSKNTLESLENRIKELKKQYNTLTQASIEAQKQKATQLQKEEAYQATIEKLKVENQSSQTQKQTNEQNIATLKSQLQKVVTSITSLQTQKEKLLEKNKAEVSQLQIKLNQLTSDIQAFQKQHTELLNTYNRTSETLKSEYQHVPLVDSVNHKLDDNWSQNLEGFYNVFNTLIGDFQSQCQQPFPTSQPIPQITYASSRPLPYIPSSPMACSPVTPVSAAAATQFTFTKIVDFSSGFPKPSSSL